MAEFFANATPIYSDECKIEPWVPERPSFTVDDETITLYGVRYSLGVFQSLAFAEIGSAFRITERKDGVVTLTRLDLDKTEVPNG